MASRCRLVRFKVARATLPVLPLAPGGLTEEPAVAPAGALEACRRIACDGTVFAGPRMMPVLSRGLAPGPDVTSSSHYLNKVCLCHPCLASLLESEQPEARELFHFFLFCVYLFHSACFEIHS